MSDTCYISSESAKSMPIEQLFEKLQAKREGLSSQEAETRLQQCGPNIIVEKKKSALLQLLRYFWGPIPWMIEIAAVLSAILHHWPDLIIISVLILINGLIGFFQEYTAGNAIEALKKNLAVKSVVLRDGIWSLIDAAQIVPGDVISIKLGNIIPADAMLFDGEYLSVDQSAMTGESLPVSKKINDFVYSGSIAKQGAMDALVISTGNHTYFGKTAKLVQQAASVSHFQKAVLQIGRFLIYISLFLAALLIAIQIGREVHFLELAQFVLVLIVASIPVAMPAVLAMTMALGALKLSRLKAIVTKLESIEEMAGIDVLCSDKTGTLTQNQLKLGDPIVFAGGDPDSLLLCASLASKAETKDPIDLAVLEGCDNEDILKTFKQVHFTPFDPTAKRTEATVIAPEGNTFYVTKGAPQVILALCHPEFEAAVQEQIDLLAQKGYRTLGVASSGDDRQSWQFLGLLALSDPLRPDAKETTKQAAAHGIAVKMLTGDNIAIAKEISHQLGLGDRIIQGKSAEQNNLDEVDGFAEVFPEHKYEIIQELQKRKHIVGMTGDGVNDAPALKQADVGIAVDNSTDAARAAASLVLTAPGLSVIIHAIEEARRIFERMNSYVIYRIAETIRAMFFIVTCILVYDFYPVTSLMIVLLALLNDIPIMTIVTDHTVLEPRPVRWIMKRVLTVASSLGGVGVVGSFFLIFLIRKFYPLPLEELQTLVFLKLSMAGHQMLFVARSRGAFFLRPFPSPILLIAILATQGLAALIGGLGLFITPVPWTYIGYLWGYTLVWMFIADLVKLTVYWLYPKKNAY